MLKFKIICSLSLTVTYILNLQSNQNSPSQASTVCDLWTSDVQARFRKGRGSRDQIANINYIVEKARKFQKNICFWLSQSFWLVIHTILWKTLQEMGIPDQLSCLLRNLYAAQEATVRTRHGTTDWFQIGKGVHQGCMLSPCLFNLYVEFIMWNARLDETQAGIEIAGRNTNNLRYADDTTLLAETKRN